MINSKDRKELQRLLSKAVDQEDVFNLDELEGFLYGLAVTPDIIMPSEWLPVVFGEEMFVVDSDKEAAELLETFMRLFNDFNRLFHDDELRFPFDLKNMESPDDLVQIQDWTYGFHIALLMRPEIWLTDGEPDNLTEDEEDLMSSLAVVHGIADPDEAEEIFDISTSIIEDEFKLQATLYSLLPFAVETILAHGRIMEERQGSFLNPRSGPPQPVQSNRIGRNDPCPCGSGNKYKKCCMRKAKIVPIH